MMSFLDALSDYLQQVGQLGNGKLDVTGHGPALAPSFARDALIRCLERLDAQCKLEENIDSLLPNPEHEFRTWQSEDRIVRFSNRMAQMLREGMARNATQRELEELVEIAIARQSYMSDALPSKIKTMELDRLAEIAMNSTYDELSGESIDKFMYASAIRAVKKDRTRTSLTSVGRIFLELKGRDAICWLLHVEAAQSFGPSDPWRISREMASQLVRWGKFSFDAKSARMWGYPDYWVSVKRLAALGLVSVEQDWDADRTEIEVLSVGRQLLSEISKVGTTPMSVLSESVLSDLTLSAASTNSENPGKLTASIESTAVAEATVRQSRLVAHEVRNMLVPVKTALGAFYREVQMAEHPGDVVLRRKESIDQGIDSVFKFIGQLVELSQFAAVPPEPFDILMAIRDAASAVESESGRRVEQVLPTRLPPVSGHRARVVTALINILRNATQAHGSGSLLIRIEAESIEGSSAVRLVVDDNGPGVPENMRRAIFDEGVSLRGGSGLGLALVREVFEKEMRGLVACEASPLGGARFVVRLPATGTERS